MASLLMATLAGALLLGGLALIGIALWPRPVRLSDALANLAGETTAAGQLASSNTNKDDVGAATENSFLERAGVWLYQKMKVPVSASTLRHLSFKGRSIADFFAEKIALGLIGLVGSFLISSLLVANRITVSGFSVGVSLLFGIAGFFLPDLRIHRSVKTTRQDASEALFTYFDLVILERLANKSASQALYSAATLSDSPLFVKIRNTLEHARLQQRPPWDDLLALAKELDLPQLADVVDVMRLDEQGASVSDTLRARVAELRNEHLLTAKIEAQELSERMTLPMVIPTVVFALVFLIPPLLRLVWGA